MRENMTKKLFRRTNSPPTGLDEAAVQCQSFPKVYFGPPQKNTADMKAPDRKAGTIYTTFNLVYAVRRCVPWKRKIWIGPI